MQCAIGGTDHDTVGIPAHPTWAFVARFAFLTAIATDASGNLYLTDSINQNIRKITPEGVVTMVAGKRGLTGNTVGTPDGAMNRPTGLAFDQNGILCVTSSNGVLKLQL
jgi:hypothetical protein